MTAPATHRRCLRFERLEDILADAERQAARNAPTVGNWSLGRMCAHLAQAMDKSIDGYQCRAPLVLRIAVRLFYKRRFLRDGFPAGLQLRGQVARELIPEETSTERGLDDLRRAITRLQTESKRSPHPVLGRMSHNEWQQFHLRHAELHLSFVADV